MDGRRRGKIEIFMGVILFYAFLGIGFWIKSNLGVEYAPSYGYILVGALLAGLIIGLFSGILILSGYYRVSGKRETNFTLLISWQDYSWGSVFLNRVYVFSTIFSAFSFGRVLDG